MFCDKCGKAIPEDNIFCPYCGNPIDSKAEISEEQLNNPKKSKKTAIVFVIVLALLACGVGGFFLYNSMNTLEIDLSSLSTEPVYNGYCGEAELTELVTLDKETVERFVETLKPKQKNKAEAFLSTVSFETEPTKSLSNDDVITVTVKYDAASAKENKIKVIKDKSEFTVQGLEERPKEISVIDVRNSGIVKELWENMDEVDCSYEGAYLSSSSSGKKIFIIYSFVFCPDIEVDNPITYYYIANTNTFKESLSGVHIDTDEIYGQTPRESLDACMKLIRSTGYKADRI